MTPQDSVKAAIEGLIVAGTTFDVGALDQIYHDDLVVLMTGADGSVNKADKAGFKSMFQAMKDAGDPPLNTWAAFDDIMVQGDDAHVLMRRRIKLTEDEQNITLSIDLRHIEGRWQVMREVIFTHPT